MDLQQALVHGDFSPKNILVHPDRIVLLDHEVAWYGDPAFDLAFMLTHLHLKQLLHHSLYRTLPDLPTIFWDTYVRNLRVNSDNLEERAGRLLLMILLARMDGKSPVEYFQGKVQEQEFVRSFVQKALGDEIFSRNSLDQLWKLRLNKFAKHENHSS